MKEQELKPCPKCKGTHQHFRQIFLIGGVRKWWITCICGFNTPVFDTLDRAFEYWNRRADNG